MNWCMDFIEYDDIRMSINWSVADDIALLADDIHNMLLFTQRHHYLQNPPKLSYTNK